MNLSMWTQFLGGKELREMLTDFARAGFKTLELSDEHGRELFEKSGDRAKTGEWFRGVADEYGISFPQGHLWITADLVEPDANRRKKTMDDLKGWLELFAAIGVRAAVLHPGGRRAKLEGWSDERIFEARTAALRELAEFADGIPVRIAMENCGEDLDLMTAIVDAVESDKIGFCLDTGHLNLIDGDQGEYIRRCGDRLLALHIADNLGVNDDHILPFSAGTVNWKEVLDALREIRYEGLFNFEVPGETRSYPMDIRLAKLDYAFRLGELMLDSA